MRATHEPLHGETPQQAADRMQKAAVTFVWMAEDHEAHAKAYRDRADECMAHATELRQAGAA